MFKYKTSQREAILKYLIINSNNHITVDDVFFNMKRNGYNVGKTTVYRFFKLLENEGKLRKFKSNDNNSACYQYVDLEQKCRNHYHFFCESCLELQHIECDYLDEVERHVYKNHTFKINTLKTTYHGCCSKCLNNC